MSVKFGMWALKLCQGEGKIASELSTCARGSRISRTKTHRLTQSAAINSPRPILKTVAPGPWMCRNVT